MRRSSLMIFCAFLVASCAVAGEGSLSMRFVYDGPVPSERTVDTDGIVLPDDLTVPDERLLVDKESRGIRNVVVYVDTSRSGTKIVAPPAPSVVRKLTMINGRFLPRILTARIGDTLKISDRGPIAYHPNVTLLQNQRGGLMVPGGNPAAVIPLNTRTSVGVPIMDDINPWMQGYVLVLDHPFVAISDSDGRLSIEGLPANTLIKFCVWHEKGRIQQVKINQTDHEWIRSRFQVVVKEGETDLGEILVPASTFEIDLRDGKEVIAR